MSTQIFWSDDHQLQEWQEEILKREFNDKRGTNSNSGPGGDRSSSGEEQGIRKQCA